MIRQSLPFFANFRRQLVQTCYMLASKTDPFHEGANLNIGLGSHPLCAV